MKHDVVLTVASLLSLLFMTFHLSHDVIRQAEGGLFGAGMIVVQAHGTVVGKSGGFFFVWTLFALSARPVH